MTSSSGAGSGGGGRFGLGRGGFDGFGGSGGGGSDLGPDARLHVVRFAPAKLNLTLAVLGQRSDGYHALHSVMAPLSLGDALTVSATPPGATRDSLRVGGLPLPPDRDNLVLKAIIATRAAVTTTWPGAPAFPPPLAARLAKRIPVAAGLGGGSSDAAAAIKAALAAWSASLEAPEMTSLASSLGSDVPFFLANNIALITGRGEFVEPLLEIKGEPPAVLLVTPALPLATQAVFKAYADGVRVIDAGRAREVSERLAADLRTGLTAASLMARAEDLASANDLQAATASIVPGLRAFTSALQRVVDRPVCQSGSGPTLWALYPTLIEARKAVRFVRLAAVNGTLPILGSGEPFIAATTIAGRPTAPAEQFEGGTSGTVRPRSVHNWYDADEPASGDPTEAQMDSKGDESR
jgi:4-diphosphocytidyl-2-C-methyl-D-erythritol kinase